MQNSGPQPSIKVDFWPFILKGLGSSGVKLSRYFVDDFIRIVFQKTYYNVKL